MITKELNGGRIRIARTEMDYKHGNGILTSAYPLEGPGTHQKVMGAITKGKLLRPTTAQTFSLIDFALSNPDNKQCKDIVSRVKNQWLLTTTENLWGKEDVILYDNIDGTMPTDRASLIKRMKDGDKAVRLVKYGFKTGNQSVSDLVANSYIIGQVTDKDFAEDVVARVAEKISRKAPYVGALDSQNRDLKKYTAVDSDWLGVRLYVHGYYHADVGYGFASGVLPKSAEGAS
ncbi:MAG: hypothetical protein AABX30_01225 [Nanoarchaeota archaeon]